MSKITVIGGINIDIEARPKEKILFRDSNPAKVKMSFGGVGRNICEDARRLGLDIGMLALIGNDSMGKAAKSHLNDLGVDVSMIETFDGIGTSTYISFLDNTGDMEVAMNDMAIVEEITPKYLEKYMYRLSQSDIICLDANLKNETLNFIGNYFNGSKTKLFYDPVSVIKCKRGKDILKNLYAIKPNVLEAAELLDMEISCDEDMIKAGEKFMEMGIKEAYITLNKDGVFYISDKEQGFIRPDKYMKIVSATGAGDSFSSCILYGIANKLPAKETAEMGMTAAQITMESDSATSEKLSIEEINRRKLK